MLDVRYRLDERIAAGAVGQVWRGTDVILERPVAVKVLRPEYAGHPETLERFRAEARHAGALSHPSIAQVYDYRAGGDGGPDDSPYLVMELVDGPSLADILDAGTIDAARSMDTVAQVAAGLAAAHRTGLVHRDIKPGNILISSDGLVKITDFGIAHAAGSAPLTAPEMVMGTAQYLAPERITGEQDGPGGDLYSLGIVLYECLVGQPPFTGTAAEVMSAHLYVPLPPLPSGIPSAVSQLVARLTAKDPAARLCDAAELASAARRLSIALGAEPPVEPAGIAQPVRPAEPLRNAEPAKQADKPARHTGKDARPARNKRMPILAAAVAAAALVAAIGVMASGALRDASTHGQASTGHGIQLNVAPSPSVAAGTSQPGARSSGPSPSPSPANSSPRQKAGTSSATQQTSGTSGSGSTTSGPASQTGTTSSGSGSGSTSGSGSGSGSGIVIQPPAPLPTISVLLP